MERCLRLLKTHSITIVTHLLVPIVDVVVDVGVDGDRHLLWVHRALSHKTISVLNLLTLRMVEGPLMALALDARYLLLVILVSDSKVNQMILHVAGSHLGGSTHHFSMLVVVVRVVQVLLALR